MEISKITPDFDDRKRAYILKRDGPSPIQFQGPDKQANLDLALMTSTTIKFAIECFECFVYLLSLRTKNVVGKILDLHIP